MIILEILLWSSLLLLSYTYVAYPIVLFVITSLVQSMRDLRFILKRTERRTRGNGEDCPAVTLIIPAYNEESVLAAKLDNVLTLDYPRERMEIIVSSDGSTDRTNEIAASYADRGVKLVHFAERRGKVAMINRVVPQAEHEIVLLSDADTIYERQAVKQLVRHLSSEKVGAVVGEFAFASPSQEYRGETHYWRYEVMLKFMESKLGATLGANGGLYAFRKKLFRPIPENTIVDDFVIPLKIVEQGYELTYTPEARVFGTTARDVPEEVIRRERIAAGNFQAILMLWRLLNPLRGYIAFTFFSHKILRWTAPFFMLSALAANIALSVLERGIYTWLLVPQIAFYASAWLGSQPGLRPWARRLCATQYYFVSMNVAMFRGFIRFIRGSQQVTWKKIKRYQE